MSIIVSPLTRIFEFNGVQLPDPGPEFLLEEVRDVYSGQYPDIISAAIEVELRGETEVYKFIRSVGTKGAGRTRKQLLAILDRQLAGQGVNTRDRAVHVVSTEEIQQCCNTLAHFIQSHRRPQKAISLPSSALPAVF